jgi:hypothetical protein
MRLVRREHAQSHACLEAKRLHAFHHGKNAIESGPVLHLAPGRAHAESRRALVASAPGRAEDLVDVEHFLGMRGSLVVARLRTVRAIFGATTGLDAEKSAELHFLLGVAGLVHSSSLVEKGKKRAVVKSTYGFVCDRRGSVTHAGGTLAECVRLELM